MATKNTYRGRVETITPEIAMKWLEKNTANRNVIQARVDAIAADIRRGAWLLTGDPIRFDVEGEMIDGQHRLWAIVEAGLPVESYVVRGLPVEAKLVIDTGAKRTLANYFQIIGEPNPPLLAGILTIVSIYDRDHYSTQGRGPTHAEGEAYLNAHPDVRDSVSIAQLVRREVKLAPSPIGAAHHINSRYDADGADEFWTAVATGVNLSAGDPALAYRRWATGVLGSRTDRPSPRTQFGHAMKAMQLWHNNQKRSRISFPAAGEPIPPDWGGNGVVPSKAKKAKAKK